MQLGCITLAGLALSSLAIAQGPLFLKARTVETAVPLAGSSVSQALFGPIDSSPASAIAGFHGAESHSYRTRHFLIQPHKHPDRGTISRLESRGIRTLGYVPGGGLLVSASLDAALDARDVRWAGAISGSDKFEPGFEESPTGHYVVEFYPDVDMAEARGLLAAAGIVQKDNPDLLRNQLLVEATLTRMQAIADEDIVSFIYAAIPELVAGIPVMACGGPAIDIAPIAAIAVTSVGEGWDGPGKGTGAIRYFFGALTTRMTDAQVKQDFVRALGEWTRYARLDFTETNRAGLEQSIDLLFASGTHNDPYPFDGRGTVLAHTFYPAPPNAEPLAGDMHFDDDEPWTSGGAIDFYSTTLHELGHALGIGHINTSGAVMYPFYRKVTALGQPDIDAVRALYAEGTGSVTPAPGDNPPPVDPPPPPAAPAAVTLRLTAPSSQDVQQTAPSITVRGTAAHPSGIASVSWTNSRGGSGAATGALDWSFSAGALPAGANEITITARANDSQAAPVSLTLRVNVTDPPPAPPTPPAAPDRIAPALAITSPGMSSYATTLPEIRVAGTASDNTGLDRVVWTLGSRSGTAAGTRTWSASIPLATGMNNIVIRAYDAAGNSSWRSLSVTKR